MVKLNKNSTLTQQDKKKGKRRNEWIDIKRISSAQVNALSAIGKYMRFHHSWITGIHVLTDGTCIDSLRSIN